MTNNEWSSKWPTLSTGEADHDKSPWPSDEEIVIEKILNEGWPSSGTDYNVKWPKPLEIIGVDLAKDERLETNGMTYKQLKSQGSNLVDEQAYLYFQCDDCNEILDPHTKSFAKLQERRVNAGWKCIWNLTGMGYKVYCAKCGET